MKRSLAILLIWLSVIMQARGDDANDLIGVWKLLSFDQEFQDGSPSRPVYGKSPKGYLILTKEGRMMGLGEAEGRVPPKTDEDRAALFRSMIGYSGTYKVLGDKWITKVDVSWNPAWNGTEQLRYFKVAGNHLEVTSDWAPSPNLPGNPVVRGILNWERVQ